MKPGARGRALLGGLGGIGAAAALTVMAAAKAGPAPPVTFARDVGPLLFDRCVTCHNPDGSAPFSLASYADARPRARLIAAVTASRSMPPWKGESGYGAFVGHKPLSDSEIKLIDDWVASGSPEGDPRELPAATWSRGWRLGQPDMVVTLPEPYVLRAGGGDVWRTFVFPVAIDSVRYVRGLEFRPNDGGVLHHARIRIDRTPASRERDELDPAAGYEGSFLRTATYPDGHFLGWTPGQAGPLVPEELAWRLDRGAHLVAELHMLPSGKPEAVSPSIGLFFSDHPPERTPAILRLGRQDLDIAPGEKAYIADDSFVLPVDVEVLAVQPHAHFRAREISAFTTLPDGTSTSLLRIEDWDVRWQHFYQYETPVALPKGTRLTMQFTFDNSAENPRNPQLPPRRVFWGEESTSEMGELWVQLLTRDEKDLRILHAAIHPKMAAEDAVGYETRLREDPTRVHLHDAAGDTYLYLGRPKEAIAHFRASLEHRPDSSAAHYNLGIALSEAGDLEQAIVCFRRALELRPDYALAHNNLGGALVRLRRVDEALRHFDAAIRLAPAEADAYYNAGSVWHALGDVSQAGEYFGHAVRLRPNWVPAVTNLAWLLAVSPHDELRDADEAVRLAEHAADLTEHGDASVMDVLAAAYASAGRFDRAIVAVAKALALEPPAHVAAAIRERQGLYKERKPYRLRLAR